MTSFLGVSIPLRFTTVLMLQLALINSYHLRVVLNIAITEIIKPENDTVRMEHDSCPEFQQEKVDIKVRPSVATPSAVKLIVECDFMGCFSNI